MPAIVNHTISDLRTGRQSWRIYLLVCSPSFAAALAVATLVR